MNVFFSSLYFATDTLSYLQCDSNPDSCQHPEHRTALLSSLFTFFLPAINHRSISSAEQLLDPFSQDHRDGFLP